ncbi:hypothetical protein Tco_1018251 [Tanacetum coccineum]|uniref:Uncharacterized protein n=1 Tax=Tanacetum coccineum TaxID=301880 RepID=A0ABQ5FTT6_9ASTR
MKVWLRCVPLEPVLSQMPIEILSSSSNRALYRIVYAILFPSLVPIIWHFLITAAEYTRTSGAVSHPAFVETLASTTRTVPLFGA